VRRAERRAAALDPLNLIRVMPAEGATISTHIPPRPRWRVCFLRAVIFANGHLSDPDVDRARLRSDDWLLAADGGLHNARRLGASPSVVIGDRWRDIAVARAVGCRGILVKTGYGATEALKPQPGLSADAVCDDLIGAAVWLLDHPVP